MAAEVFSEAVRRSFPAARSTSWRNDCASSGPYRATTSVTFGRHNTALAFLLNAISSENTRAVRDAAE